MRLGAETRGIKEEGSCLTVFSESSYLILSLWGVAFPLSINLVFLLGEVRERSMWRFFLLILRDLGVEPPTKLISFVLKIFIILALFQNFKIFSHRLAPHFWRHARSVRFPSTVFAPSFSHQISNISPAASSYLSDRNKFCPHNRDIGIFLWEI